MYCLVNVNVLYPAILRGVALYRAVLIRTEEIEQRRTPSLADDLSLMQVPPAPVDVGVASVVVLAEFPMLDEPIDGPFNSQLRAAPGEDYGLGSSPSHDTVRVGVQDAPGVEQGVVVAGAPKPLR
jgi:hypothetical protein